MRGPIAAILFVTVGSWVVPAHALTLEERIEAQAAVDRVYEFHRSGSVASRIDGLSSVTAERKVRRYLEETLALEQVWHTPVTAEMLDAELERIAEHTRFPDRLREIYAALNDDPLLVRECFVRAVLVDRLARGLFRDDVRFQAAPRKAAEEIRRRLNDGESVSSPAARLHRVSHEETVKFGLAAPLRPGEVSSVSESPDAFTVVAVTAVGRAGVDVSEYRIAKTTWEEGWARIRSELIPSIVTTVARSAAELPEPGARSLSDDTWDSASLDDYPDGRERPTAVWTGSEMIVWGGDTFGARFDTGARYDPLTDAWSPTSVVGAPTPRTGHSAVWTGSRMLVWGGEGITSGVSVRLGTGSSYDPATDTWAPITEVNAPAARTLHTAVWTGSRMLVWGGQDFGFLGTGAAYDPATDGWTSMATANAPSPRSGHAAAWTGGRMLVWGGVGPSATATGAAYDPATDAWTVISEDGAPSARSDATGVWTGGRWILWGGTADDGTPLASGGIYDPSMDSWTPTDESGAPEARYGHGAAWTGSRMLVWGGAGAAGHLDTGASFDPATNGWTSTSGVGSPSPRGSFAFVWDGSRLLVWGGYEFAFPFVSRFPDSGGRYDPATDSWTPTALSPAPERRAWHTAVWTGAEMIVWGGLSDTSARNDGARYDPLVDAWTGMSSLGAPAARYLHTAVWTGSRMLVWGGDDAAGTRFGDGGSYDPSADAWTSITTGGAPAARWLHTAIWTGSRMIVWGGEDVSSQRRNDGGVYDPAGDAWQPTATVGAPGARSQHSAIWTGSRMLIWGGGDSAGDLNSGAAYDPGTDAWTSMSTFHAPTARHAHTAAWTGRLMLVWGGFGGGTAGGRYDPVSDTWSPMTASGAPPERTGHAAAWTGTRWVIWGGGPDATSYRTGARYSPVLDAWEPVSAVLPVAARKAPTGVWTGDSVLVWGGTNDAEPMSSGGIYGVALADSDGDGAEDSIDCAPTDPTATLVPEEVTGVGFDPGPEDLRWDPAWHSAGSSTVHDVVRGSLAELPVGTGAAESCLASGTSGTTVHDGDVPSPGAGYWYLVRGRNTCGVGSYGNRTDGQERLSAACP